MVNADRLDAERGRVLVEESREIVLVLDAAERVVAASRRAREALTDIEEGAVVPPALLQPERGRMPLRVTYEVDGQSETLLYLGQAGELAAYEELRAGFTAAVSHELRTPLARILALLESADLPGSDPFELIAQARGEIDQIRELIDDVLFLSELETGRQVVALGSTPALPVAEEVFARLEERAARADVHFVLDVDPAVELPLRPRMLRTVLENLAENSLRYAGPRSTFTLSLHRGESGAVLVAADDGAGIGPEDVSRLFERFYRADRARASRGTGLGLAIVKHVVTSAGGGVDASGAPGRGLEIRCTFP